MIADAIDAPLLKDANDAAPTIDAGGQDMAVRDAAMDAGPAKDMVAAPICGDGKPDPSEQCDQGAANSDSARGKGLCRKDCKWAPFCGDGKTNPPDEDCDNGEARNNNSAYGPGACREDCKRGPFCGDGVTNYKDEECDYGPQNAANAYGEGKCTTECKHAPYCGDGKPGDGEECDLGKALNSGAPGGCSSSCKRVPAAPADAG